MSEPKWMTCDWETWKKEALRIASKEIGFPDGSLHLIPWDTMKEMYFDDPDWRCSPREAWQKEYEFGA